MIKALGDMGFKNVVFVADQLYELKKDKIQGRPVPALTGAVMFPIYHGNLPVSAKKTLGQKGNKERVHGLPCRQLALLHEAQGQGCGEIPQGQLPDPEGADCGASDGGLGAHRGAGLGVRKGSGYRVKGTGDRGIGSRVSGLGYEKGTDT